MKGYHPLLQAAISLVLGLSQHTFAIRMCFSACSFLKKPWPETKLIIESNFFTSFGTVEVGEVEIVAFDQLRRGLDRLILIAKTLTLSSSASTSVGAVSATCLNRLIRSGPVFLPL